MRTLILLITINCSLFAQHTISVRWRDTPTYLGNQTSIARLASGVRLEGEWRSVTPTSFTMFVRKSSGGPSQKGTVTVDRADLEYLSFRPFRYGGRVTGSVAGFPRRHARWRFRRDSRRRSRRRSRRNDHWLRARPHSRLGGGVGPHPASRRAVSVGRLAPPGPVVPQQALDEKPTTRPSWAPIDETVPIKLLWERSLTP
jgi:hypothetical protein